MSLVLYGLGTQPSVAPALPSVVVRVGEITLSPRRTAVLIPGRIDTILTPRQSGAVLPNRSNVLILSPDIVASMQESVNQAAHRRRFTVTLVPRRFSCNG